MPRRTRSEQTATRGIFEKDPGSNVWCIRYEDLYGKYRCEKVGSYSPAVNLYQERKTEARLGVKMPENIRHKGVTFKELADAVLTYVDQEEYKNARTTKARVKRLSIDFGDMEAAKILPEDISARLAENTNAPATSNRYKPLP